MICCRTGAMAGRKLPGELSCAGKEGISEEVFRQAGWSFETCFLRSSKELAQVSSLRNKAYISGGRTLPGIFQDRVITPVGEVN